MDPQHRARLEAELAQATRRVEQLQEELELAVTGKDYEKPNTEAVRSRKMQLENDDIRRYGRQLVLPEIGVEGQLKIVSKSVLIVGAGGLGCPVATYLAGAGVGRLALVDDDVVELSNLHRQVLHTTGRIGMNKTDSARRVLHDLNANTVVDVHTVRLNPKNVERLAESCDVIVDCTDNLPTRYLLNDAAVRLGKPLVSGSALRLEGQLSVYNFGNDSPCYRCVYPKPPAAESVTNCSDGGVMGMVPGVIGCLQALEVLKLLVGPSLGTPCSGRLLLFDGKNCKFHQIKLRGKRDGCNACGTNADIDASFDYTHFCGVPSCSSTPRDETIERLSPDALAKLLSTSKEVFIVDVRPRVEVEICRLNPSTNIPLQELKQKKIKWLDDTILSLGLSKSAVVIVAVCRRGNDSRIAAAHLKSLAKNSKWDIDNVYDLEVRLACLRKLKAHQIDMELR